MTANTNISKYYRKKLLVKNSISLPFGTAWSSPSNIALIKYWGKYGNQLPMSPSVSFSLESSRSIMRMTISPKSSVEPAVSIQFRFHGEENYHFSTKIRKYFESLLPFCRYLNQFHFELESENTFPHSAGIASSASSMSALALCLASVEQYLFDELKTDNEFLMRASWLARLASGSAARSVYPGFSIWGKTPEMYGSSNLFAVPPTFLISPVFNNVHDAILIVKSGEKKVSSRAGHSLMNNHPFRKARISQANRNMHILMRALHSGDWKSFSTVVENEAFTLHSLMMSSSESFTLLEPETLYFVQEIRSIREQNNVNLCFTLDAGPNIHLIYDARQRKKVLELITPLIAKCENKQWIDDKIGKGPYKVI